MPKLDAKQRAKMVLIKRRLTPADVAAKAGLSLTYVYGLLNGHFVSQVAREKIEDTLGEPIWSTRREFESRSVRELATA